MKLTLYRYNDNGESTLGLFFINGKLECYSLEDEKRTKKVWGETRIPEGTYDIVFRNEGGHHERYAKKFPVFHKGMLHIINVPNFQYILIHIGNTDEDTAGCILVGNLANNNNLQDGFLSESTSAYVNMYRKVASALEQGIKVSIEIKDLQQHK